MTTQRIRDAAQALLANWLDGGGLGADFAKQMHDLESALSEPPQQTHDVPVVAWISDPQHGLTNNVPVVLYRDHLAAIAAAEKRALEAEVLVMQWEAERYGSKL